MHARKLSFGAGRVWMREAFALYRKNVPLLTSFCMLYLMLVAGSRMLPLVFAVMVTLALPILSVAVANACRVVDRDLPPTRANLFAGIATRYRVLLQLGLIQILASMAIAFLVSMTGPLPDPSKADTDVLLGLMLRMGIFMLPLVMAFWFSPMLAAWNDIPAGKAIFFSFVACWRNWRAFAAYGLLAIALFILISVVLGLLSAAAGALAQILGIIPIMVVIPVMMSGVYISYREIFVNAQDNRAQE